VVASPNPTSEEQWCDQRRAEVVAYLKQQRVDHGQVGEWPAWHLVPYVSIWAIESKKSPGWVGWWVISGDLPTDYVSAQSIKHPRDAMRAIALRWIEQSKLMARGESVPGIELGQPGERKNLAPLLEGRATTLLKWANDDAVWEEDAL
jgi:hypothetical protein